jgi:hypothetical protein
VPNTKRLLHESHKITPSVNFSLCFHASHLTCLTSGIGGGICNLLECFQVGCDRQDCRPTNTLVVKNRIGKKTGSANPCARIIAGHGGPNSASAPCPIHTYFSDEWSLVALAMRSSQRGIPFCNKKDSSCRHNSIEKRHRRALFDQETVVSGQMLRLYFRAVHISLRPEL